MRDDLQVLEETYLDEHGRQDDEEGAHQREDGQRTLHAVQFLP